MEFPHFLCRSTFPFPGLVVANTGAGFRSFRQILWGTSCVILPWTSSIRLDFIAALDAATGNATAWNPNASATVDALAVSGSTVYAGGSFTSIGGQSRSYFAEFPPDQIAPAVVSNACPDANPTSASLVWFTVAFSENVAYVDAGDFALTAAGVAGAMVANVRGTDAIRTVTVATGSGDGTIRLDVIDNDSIRDGGNNPLGGPGAGNGNFTGGQTYLIDRTPPQSQMTGPSGTTMTTVLTLRWTRSDPGAAASGVRSVRVYWKKDAGAYNLLGTYLRATTSATFNTATCGGNGTYWFYSVATDNAGNAEAAPPVADIVIQVRKAGVQDWWPLLR